jgi:hypothetical protein
VASSTRSIFAKFQLATEKTSCNLPTGAIAKCSSTPCSYGQQPEVLPPFRTQADDQIAQQDNLSAPTNALQAASPAYQADEA